MSRLLSLKSVALGVAGKTRLNALAVRQFSAGKSWVPTNDEKLQQVTISSLIHDVSEQQRELNSQVVPWFLRKMPAAYFRQVPEAFRFQHIKAITVLRDLMQSELSLKIETPDKEGAGKYHTYINSSSKSGLLYSQIKSLNVPADYYLKNVNVFSSMDGELALNIFHFNKIGTAHAGSTMDQSPEVMNYISDLKAGKFKSDPNAPVYDEKLHSADAMATYLKGCSVNYASNTNPQYFLNQRGLYAKVVGTDNAAVRIEPATEDDAANKAMSWVTIAGANVLPEVLLRLCSGVITAKGLDVSRANLDIVDNSVPDQSVVMLRLLVSPSAGGRNLNTDAEFAATLRRDLQRIKWLDDSTTNLGLTRHPSLGLDKAEVITAYCSMLHGPLYKVDPQNFASISSIVELVASNDKHVGIADSIATLFLERFNPKAPLPEAEFQARSGEIRQKIGSMQVAGQVLLNKMLDSVHATLRTNFFHPDRYALSMRLNPAIMFPANTDKVMPFGLIFGHGRHFNAFHNRFRDIARGGLRIVTPQNSDLYALESSRQYDEVYNLSYAQQLKNKDIPEGGSKGVVMVNTPVIPPAARPFAMRKSVKAFVDSLLDLTVTSSVKNLVDFYGKDELIYLGPDEQVIPADIEWIVQRAGERGYPVPDAFMSSKKENGFNHKEFGVTSEGVAVFLDVALRRILNINPTKDNWTIKITGGPDGDVAGNLMRILDRDYGNHCKILGIADGYGVAEDPNGLDHEELIRLFNESKSIDNFNPKKLNKGGVVLSATTEEGFARRNSMHFRIKSDVFVPGGGRPNTINGDNWRQFLDADGKPSSPLIVEGANIFTTPEARLNLFKHAGVSIVKDSSANKCGVVTSSCEVMASMLLSKQEFVGMKKELVDDVLEKLRYLAKAEGELMFREYKNYPGALPHFSERISFAIAKVTDAISDALLEVQPSDALFKELSPLIRETLPKKLADVAGDRIVSRFPVQYQRNAIASTLASKIVYNEGIHFIESQPVEKIAERAFQYYREEQKLNEVINDVEKLTFPAGKEHEKKQVVDLLKRGGVRTSINVF
jgi:glutamate dehydrogenase